VTLVVVGALAAISFATADGDLGYAATTFLMVAVVMGLYTLFVRREARSQDRAYAARWRSVCHILDGDHHHDGDSITGRWKGEPFRAYAVAFVAGQYPVEVSVYGVAMPAACSGPAWIARREDVGRWTLKADSLGLRDRLLAAGLLAALEDADGAIERFGPEAHLEFRPRTAEVVLEDASGEPAGAENLSLHLDLVRRAVDIHRTAMATAPVGPERRPRLRVGDPPFWLATLWLPAALAFVLLVHRSLWAAMLLPAAFAAPYVWRIRLP
jgi:hypothetical protein